MKKYKGKAIYSPSGKAGEYSYWACNFYVGCSNGCEYCYCKKGILKTVMGMDKPQLKKCFKGEEHALEVFEKELKANLSELQKHGIFFSFTTDPMLPETIRLTKDAIDIAINYKVPVKILTKCSDWIKIHMPFFLIDKKYISIGFTLTGHDELEKGASTNLQRIEAMEKLHDAGIKTWASVEPIIDFVSAIQMIAQSNHCCDYYKIGLMSGAKFDNFVKKGMLNGFISATNNKIKKPIYWKDSILKAAGINRADLPSNCVSRDYNIFNS